jgi:Tfp pilus assembly protein PilX
MQASPLPGSRARGFALRARGYMMIIVLVALVAMTISGIALIRSMDTNQVVSGNMAFRNATLHSSDLSVAQAIAWIQANAAGGVLNASAPANGYYAQEAEPDWSQQALWATCGGCAGVDPAGNNISYVIHRMCTLQGSPNNPGNFCSAVTSSMTGAGGSFSSDAVNFTGTATYFYRITVRSMGPRNTVTYSQAFVTL